MAHVGPGVCDKACRDGGVTPTDRALGRYGGLSPTGQVVASRVKRIVPYRLQVKRIVAPRRPQTFGEKCCTISCKLA